MDNRMDGNMDGDGTGSHKHDARKPAASVNPLNAFLPDCQKCHAGTLIPLSDYGQDGSSVLFKAWVCTNPECGFSLRVDKGEVAYGQRIAQKRDSRNDERYR